MNEQILNSEVDMLSVFDYMDSVMNYGMKGKAGAEYPVIIRRWEENDVTYQYPSTYFSNIRTVNRLYLNIDTKANRITYLKHLVDKLISKDIDIHLYHLGMFLIYPFSGSSLEFEDSHSIGKKRLKYIEKLPKFELKNNDDFLTSIWENLIQRRFPDVGEEVVRVPQLSEIRMLFTTEQFGSFTGSTYSDADWVEPIYGNRLEVKKWTSEKDPMIHQITNDDMLEGYITLGHEGSEYGLRHFVSGKPLQSGTYIEVKFGDGWIPGRYEWSFKQGDPILIHSKRNERFTITEGSLVRVHK